MEGHQNFDFERSYLIKIRVRTSAEWGGLGDILHSKVLPGITATVSCTSGISSASSLTDPSVSSYVYIINTRQMRIKAY